jgi:hypothetical protein
MKKFARLISVATFAVTTTSVMAAPTLQPMDNAELDKVSAGTLINVVAVDVVDINNLVSVGNVQNAVNILGISKQLQTFLKPGCGC